MTKYSKSGIVKIASDLELKDFEWYVDWDNDVNMSVNVAKMALSVEVFMIIEGGTVRHSRMIPIAIPSEVSQSVIMSALLALPQFENSTEVF